MKKNWYMCLLSGIKYRLPESMTKNLDRHQLKLIKAPPDNCKKCYGRGYIGYNTTLQIYSPCKCVKNLVDLDQSEIIIETPKTTNDMVF